MKQPSAARLSDSCRTAAVLLVTVAVAGACGSPSPKDPYCSQTPLASGVAVKSGQGALQVEGATAAYFYVSDAAGKSVNHANLGKTLALPPGQYQLKVNNSAHPIAIEKGALTKCSTGTLLVTGATREYYYVHDTSGKALQHDTLGKAISLMPGPYGVKVNKSEASADVKLNQTTEIKTGTLVVQGDTGEYYYVTNALGEALNHNTLAKPLAFFPGSYAVKINNTVAKVDVVSEQVTELKTGTLMVKGLTNEYFYVSDSLGKALNHQTINKPLAFFPGTYRVAVNKSEKSVVIVAAQMTEAQTGSLIVEGVGAPAYYYVSDKTGNALNHNSLDKALSFFPGEYAVKLGQDTRPAAVEAGQTTRVKF